MQRRVVWLFEQLGLRDTRAVCASNVVFARSVKAAGIKFREWAERCWPVHQKIMDIVSPALIVVFGREPYEYVRQKLGAIPLEGIRSGHWHWMCRASRTDGGPAIIGLPHLSRYEIRGKNDVVAWIKRIAGPGLGA
jgi:uracil-DNA glycosylase